MSAENKKVSPPVTQDKLAKTLRTGPARQKKEAIVEETAQRLNESVGVVFTNYQGLTHKQIEDLKRGLKEVGASFSVTKNTLLRLSLGKTDKFKDKIKDEIFNDPTATLFIAGDIFEALKKLAKVNKDLGLPKVKLGILEGTIMDEAQVMKMASLPSRDTLIAQLVGTLNSPIQGLVVVLNGNLQKLVMVLSAVARLPRPASPPAKQSEAAREPSDGGQAKSKPAPQAPDQTSTEDKSEAQSTKLETNPNDQNTNV